MAVEMMGEMRLGCVEEMAEGTVFTKASWSDLPDYGTSVNVTGAGNKEPKEEMAEGTFFTKSSWSDLPDYGTSVNVFGAGNKEPKMAIAGAGNKEPKMAFAGAGNQEPKTFWIRSRVPDRYIDLLKAKPPCQRRRMIMLSEEMVSRIPPKKRAIRQANYAKLMAMTNMVIDENIRIYDEYTRNGVAYQVIEVTDKELEKMRRDGEPYEFVDAGAEHGIQV